VGEGRVRGYPLIRLDAETHLATFSPRGRRKTDAHLFLSSP
jgi:hypothetical protein